MRRHGGTGEPTRRKHQRVLQMGVVGGTIYGLKRRLPVEEVRIGDQAGGKNGQHASFEFSRECSSSCSRTTRMV